MRIGFTDGIQPFGNLMVVSCHGIKAQSSVQVLGRQAIFTTERRRTRNAKGNKGTILGHAHTMAKNPMAYQGVGKIFNQRLDLFVAHTLEFLGQTKRNVITVLF